MSLSSQRQVIKEHGLVKLFVDQVLATPDNNALVFENRILTYHQLNLKANQLAHFLLSLKTPEGVSFLVGNPLIAIAMDRSADMIIGLLAILKAGGAYVPIDPDYPDARIRFMLEDSRTALLLTKSYLSVHRVFDEQPHYCQIVCVDKMDVSEQAAENPTVSYQPDDLAYVIYTSGSTGKPKGVSMPQSALINLLHWQSRQLGLKTADNTLQFSSLSFDVSFQEIFSTFVTGGKLVLIDNETRMNGKALLDYLEKHKIERLFVPFVMLQHVCEQKIASRTSLSLRNIITAGEQLRITPAIRDFFNALPFCRLHNHYGPSETHVVTSFTLAEEITNWASLPPIGKTIANTRIYILDELNQPQANGVAGEIAIASAGLARGYHNRPELTAEKFIEIEVLGKSERIYKTGDLGRYLPDGNLEFLGRIDLQIKLRGFRIEPGEIEAVISEHPTIQQAVVGLHEQNNDKRLIAWFVTRKPEQTNCATKTIETGKVIEQWQHIWNETYQQPLGNIDPQFNTTGWVSSYTRTAIPESEMKQWLGGAVEQILSLSPQNVLEIGCGSGMLLFRIAPHCHHYTGLDVSETALMQIDARLTIASLAEKVTLLHRSADNLDGINATPFDTVIINSVTQCFPSIDYLLTVLEKAMSLVLQEGVIFIGDVCNFRLLEAFHASVQFHQADDSVSLVELKQRIQKAVTLEKQLFIDPELFIALRQLYPRITDVQIQLKPGLAQNEMTRFRYDVMLHLDSKVTPSRQHQLLDWQQHSMSLKQLRQLLQEHQTDTVYIKNIANARLFAERKILEMRGYPENDVKTLRSLIGKLDKGFEPDAFRVVSEGLPWRCFITHSGQYDFSAIYQHHSLTGFLQPVIDHQKPLSSYGNHPFADTVDDNQLAAELCGFVKQRLPDYMIPLLFIPLASMPLTPNGKIDRKALVVPVQRSSVESRLLPGNATEQKIASAWKQVLKLDEISIHDSFFELGGHSLLVMQVLALLHDDYPSLKVIDLFTHPRIYSLANYLQEKAANSQAVNMGQQRGENRRSQIASRKRKKTKHLIL
jgi:amino acid adenylation domain-containing protein